MANDTDTQEDISAKSNLARTLSILSLLLSLAAIGMASNAAKKAEEAREQASQAANSPMIHSTPSTAVTISPQVSP